MSMPKNNQEWHEWETRVRMKCRRGMNQSQQRRLIEDVKKDIIRMMHVNLKIWEVHTGLTSRIVNKSQS